MLEEKGIAVTSNQSVKLKDSKVNPASLNLTIEAKGKDNTPFDLSVEISENSLYEIIEEMKKTSDYCTYCMVHINKIY